MPSTYCEALQQQRGVKSSALAKILFNANILSEVYLLYKKGMANDKQVTEILCKLSIEEELWQEFLEKVAETKSAY